MNSEELEQSLRTEFESYFKNVLADVRQEVSAFHQKIESEFEKHRSLVDEAFNEFSTRVAPDRGIDEGVAESIVEHLRLARDEGARITATAIAEAEQMEKEMTAAYASSVGTRQICQAVNDISSKTTQTAILKALIEHAGQFTPRGAFFIIRNGYFVGWRAFGQEAAVDEQTVREVFFSVSSSTVLGETFRSLTTVESSHGNFDEDSLFLEKLEFGQPSRMFAVPLVVRGRVVAVLYADEGSKGKDVDVQALESLARVASLTVEVLASMPAARPQGEAEGAANEEEKRSSYEQVSSAAPVAENAGADEPQSTGTEIGEAEAPYSGEAAEEQTYEASAEEETYTEPVAEAAYPAVIEGDSFSVSPSGDSAGFDQNSYSSNYVPDQSVEVVSDEAMENGSYANETPVQADDFQSSQPGFEASYEGESYEVEQVYDEAPAWERSAETPDHYAQEDSPAYEVSDVQPVEAETVAAAEPVREYEYEPVQSVESSYQFEERAQAFEPPQVGTESFSSDDEQSHSSGSAENGQSNGYASEPVSQSTSSYRGRFSDRRVDLPIEVAEDERPDHSEARRFARLLVSEIKLYNEQKVRDGRQAGDLYDRLREAIDRSREMYEKRIKPGVAEKFDYFHYELVNNLAEGDEAKLGSSYPGSKV